LSAWLDMALGLSHGVSLPLGAASFETARASRCPGRLNQ
jgi:hypothetical protein